MNTSDQVGGAARAAFRLHQALLRYETTSEMLVARANSAEPSIYAPNSTVGKGLHYVRSYLDSLPTLLYPNRKTTPFSVGGVGAHDLLQRISEICPDIVHLHWINGGFVGLNQLPKIRQPIVWSLHDMWAFTGGCHYNNEGCYSYERSCGQCPVLGSSRQHDLSSHVWGRKRRFFDKIKNLTIVGLSRWVADQASRSSLFAGRRIINLPNTIDCSVYRRIDRAFARRLWGISPDARIVGFGAINAASDYNKGYDLLVKALTQVSELGFKLVVFGASSTGSGVGEDLPFSVHYAGHLHDDISMMTLYNAVDVMVVPSRQENLSNVIMESLSCGTPVVGFDIGGNSDLVDHKKNGYLAQAYEAEDLAVGIRWVMEETSGAVSLRAAAREKVLRQFDYGVVAPRYKALFHNVLKDGTQDAAVRN